MFGVLGNPENVDRVLSFFSAKSKDRLFDFSKLNVRYLFVKNGQCLRVAGYPENVKAHFFFFWGALSVPKSP